MNISNLILLKSHLLRKCIKNDIEMNSVWDDWGGGGEKNVSDTAVP